MKVCILKGSPRKQGNTNALVSVVSGILTGAGERISEFDLHDMELKPCTACRGCQKDWTRVYCVQKDDMQPIFDAIQESDLIVLATPIYSWYCTPPMKSVLDRLVYAMNMYYGEQRGPSLWSGKRVAIVTTCGYRPEKGADLFEEGIRRYCKHSGLNYAGMLCERHMGYHTVFMDEEKKARAVEFAEGLLRS